jgi:hypothetical protein
MLYGTLLSPNMQLLWLLAVPTATICKRILYAFHRKLPKYV